MQTNMIIHLLYPRSISVEQDLVCTLKYCTILIQSTILSQNISPEPPNIILLILSCLKGPVFFGPFISDMQLKVFVTMLWNQMYLCYVNLHHTLH